MPPKDGSTPNDAGFTDHAYRSFSAGKPRPTTPLEAIKFICKDLWQLLFRKQIDNLKTNHRGNEAAKKAFTVKNTY